MTCRHSLGDPNCTSGKAPKDLVSSAQTTLRKWGYKTDIYNQPQDYTGRTGKRIEETWTSKPSSPDSTDFEILDVYQREGHLLLRVKYPSCKKCSYEGTKLLLYLNTDLTKAIKWRIIDPHFADPTITRTAKEAPPPDARFPASNEGLALAIKLMEISFGI